MPPAPAAIRPETGYTAAMPAQLHQINMEYQAAEDRLLLRVNTTNKQEFRLWLTRRFTGQFWEALIRILEQKPEIRRQPDPDVKKAMIALTQEKALRKEQFEKTFAEDARSFPLGDAPVLLTGFSYAPERTGGEAAAVADDGPRMTFQTVRGAEIGLAVNDEVLFSLARLLSQVVAQTGWGLAFDLGPGPGTGAPASLRVH